VGEWKEAYFLHKLAHRDPRRGQRHGRGPDGDLQQRALARRLLARLANVGKLAVGAAADVIFVDYHAITPLSAGNLPWHIIFGFESSMVTTTIVGGKVLMRDRQLLTLDEAAITARSRELATKVWRRSARIT
jgi:cytosine/adenosine deaminase-related metal-dependent hydrolase